MNHDTTQNALSSLETLPDFLSHLALAFALTLAFLAIYTLITPQREFTLIRAGNVAASAALAGSLLGFVVALMSAIAHSVSLLDCAIWGAIALLVQLLTFAVIRFLMRSIVGDIEKGNAAVGILLGVVSFAAGLLNAACMTY
jgi:putative membrane protein